MRRGDGEEMRGWMDERRAGGLLRETDSDRRQIVQQVGGGWVEEHGRAATGGLKDGAGEGVRASTQQEQGYLGKGRAVARRSTIVLIRGSPASLGPRQLLDAIPVYRL